MRTVLNSDLFALYEVHLQYLYNTMVRDLIFIGLLLLNPRKVRIKIINKNRKYTNIFYLYKLTAPLAESSTETGFWNSLLSFSQSHRNARWKIVFLVFARFSRRRNFFHWDYPRSIFLNVNWLITPDLAVEIEKRNEPWLMRLFVSRFPSFGQA